MSKEERLRQFNYYAIELLKFVKDFVSTSLESKIDTLLNSDLKNPISIVLMNNFVHFICEDKDVSENLKKLNVDFFVNFDKSNFKGKFGSDLLYDTLMTTVEKLPDKTDFIVKVNNLRKIAMAYEKL